MTATLAVIILNYKTPAETCVAAESVMADLPEGGQLVIVDNASGDGSADHLSKWQETQPNRDNILVIESPDNHGFSAGNNIGIEAVDADFYFLLNSDTLVRPGAIRTLLTAATAYNGPLGLMAPTLEDEDGTVQASLFSSPSILNEFLRAASTGFLDKAFRRKTIAWPVAPSAPLGDWVSFAAVLISRQAIQRAGVLDADYFMYFEDADYCLTLTRAGFDLAVCPGAHVVHYRGGSSSVKTSVKNRARLPRYYHASRTRFFFKQKGHFGLFAANIAFTLGWLLNRCRAFLRQPTAPVCDQEQKDIWINFWRPGRAEHRNPQP